MKNCHLVKYFALKQINIMDMNNHGQVLTTFFKKYLMYAYMADNYNEILNSCQMTELKNLLKM